MYECSINVAWALFIKLNVFFREYFLDQQVLFYQVGANSGAEAHEPKQPIKIYSYVSANLA